MKITIEIDEKDPTKKFPEHPWIKPKVIPTNPWNTDHGLCQGCTDAVARGESPICMCVRPNNRYTLWQT